MTYSASEIQKMLKDGEISKAQASTLFLKLHKKEPTVVKKVEPAITLVKELKQFTAQVEQAIKNQSSAISVISEFIPVLSKVYRDISKQSNKTLEPVEWEIQATRDDDGLIEFPIKLRVVK